MRRLAALAVLLAAGCGSTRPLEVPPPYDEGGVLVTVRPRAYVEWPLPFETIRGAVENRTGRDIDLFLYLNLVDGRGAVVGHASVHEEDFRRGARRSFEAFASPGDPFSFDLRLFEEAPPYTRVARGCAWDQRALERLSAGLGALAAWVARLLPQEAAGPDAQVRAS